MLGSVSCFLTPEMKQKTRDNLIYLAVGLGVVAFILADLSYSDNHSRKMWEKSRSLTPLGKHLFVWIGRRTDLLVRYVFFTSSEVTWKEIKRALPKDVVIAQSVASRPVAIRTRPMRRALCLASNVHQRSPR
jgi:hypothetical protein